MDKFITLTLPRNDVGQIIDGLEQRRIIWQATAEYLEAGSTTLSDYIEECYNSHEAQAITDCYQHIIDTIRRQRDKQLIQQRNSTTD